MSEDQDQMANDWAAAMAEQSHVEATELEEAVEKVLEQPEANLIKGALVEARPDIAENKPPNYPRSARIRGWEGQVTLSVLVSASGKVIHVDVIRSSGHRILDQVARRAIEEWQFHPALRYGSPVESRVEVPIDFQLRSSRH